MKVTIAIPNFNGEKLLEKNLPNIIESNTDEILILDDGSSDNSLQILDKFKVKSLKCKVLIHKKNKGFIPSVNELFSEASGDLIILLNNDVWVEKDFIKPLLKHFDNPKVFAVTLHEEGEGSAISFWKDGFYEFKRGVESEKIQKSAWASGGSAIFRKSIWEKLGGFDEIFVPFYWEDIDLSFRALKAGYEILWEPQSNVKHEHETTIKKNFNEKYIRWVQERNQLLFIWKNITDSKLKSEHRRGLIKKLFSSGLGYWIPFFWAVFIFAIPSAARNLKINHENSRSVRDDTIERSDPEAISYAS